MLYVIEINLFISLQVQMHMDDRYTLKRNYLSRIQYQSIIIFSRLIIILMTESHVTSFLPFNLHPRNFINFIILYKDKISFPLLRSYTNLKIF